MDTKELRVGGLGRLKETNYCPSKWGYEGQTVIITELPRGRARFRILSPREDQKQFHTPGPNQHEYLDQWQIAQTKIEPL